jgi:branched-chain amino acid transport system substrate-binding protein
MLVAGCAELSPVGVGVALSQSFINAARLAVADAVAEGGVPPLDTVMLGDGWISAVPAIRMAEQFVAQPGLVAVIGHSNSAASLAASPIYNGAEVVQIAPTSTAARYAEAGPYSFRLAPPDTKQGEVIAAAVRSRLPRGGRLGVFYVNDDYGRGLRAAVLGKLDTSRYRVTFDRPHNDEDLQAPSGDSARRVAELARALEVTRPEVLLLLARFHTVELYLSAIRETLPGATLIGGDGIGPAHFRAAEHPGWAGVRYADFLDFERSEALREFRRRYAEAYGTPARSAEVLSYDAMRLVLAGVAEGARTGPALRDWLLSLGTARPAFEGLSGPIRFGPDGEIDRPYVLQTIPPAP